ncbi:unnamed protein product [Durusdinium trenchii]|uniref:Uncharacterized protein n=1 Tax=Durusdinium trenchii TaxID=1381693 RepID=A0ABP0LN50_9DINO
MSFDDASSCTDDTFGFNEGGLARPCSARTTIILTDSSASSHSNHEPTIRNGSGSGSDSDVVVEEADHTGDTTEDDQDSLNLLAFEILSVTMYEHHHTFPSGASDASDLDMGRFGEGDAAGGPRGNSDRSGTSTSHWGSDGAESRVDSDDSNTNRESEDVFGLMKRPSSADASSASSRQKRSKGSLRGLLVGSDHIGRFFDPDPSKRKTCEIRNFNVRCVKPQEEIYLAQSGLKDSYGNGVFCVRGKAIFKGNTFVPHSEEIWMFFDIEQTKSDINAVHTHGTSIMESLGVKSKGISDNTVSPSPSPVATASAAAQPPRQPETKAASAQEVATALHELEMRKCGMTPKKESQCHQETPWSGKSDLFACDGLQDELERLMLEEYPDLLAPGQANAADLAAKDDDYAAKTSETETKLFHVEEHQHHPGVVRNMDDYFGFFKHAVHVALDEVHAVHDVCTGETTDIIFDKMALIHKLNDLSLSTSYSGVGSPETCLHTLCHYIKEATGLQPAKPSILFQVEYDASCREELQLYNSLGSAGKVPPVGPIIRGLHTMRKDLEEEPPTPEPRRRHRVKSPAKPAAIPSLYGPVFRPILEPEQKQK